MHTPSLITQSHLQESRSSVKDYILLMKPRVMSLVVFTSICGLLNAKQNIHPFIGFIAIIFITMGAGAAGAFNMWYDRDIDKIMKRTQYRPLIIGTILPDEALAFSIVVGFFAIFLMALCVNFIAAILLAISIFYYCIIYTIILKRHSIQNVVIGGGAGALPALIGSASADNYISLEGSILFLIIFLWTPPHSWALILYRIDEYKNCNIPMMPIIKGVTYTKYLMLFYSILMVLSTILPFCVGMASYGYLIISVVLNSAFIYYSLALFQKNQHGGEKKLFIYSIYYLFVIFLILLINPLLAHLNCNFKF